MYRTGDVIDNNDLAYVIERFGNPRRVLSAPISRFKIGEHKGKPKINPHVSSFFMKDGRTVSVFHVKPVYYLHVNGEWRPLSEVTTHHGNRKIILNNKWEQIEPWYLRWLMKRCELIGGQVLIPWRFDNVPIREGQEIYFTVTTVYPDPDVEVTTVDGLVRQSYATGSGVDWGVLRGDAGNAAIDNGATYACHDLLADNVTNKWKKIDRAIILFDASSITDTDTKDSAILSLYGSTKVDGLVATPTLDIYTSTPASNTALVGGDYAQTGTTSQTGSAQTYANFSTTAYNDFTFNATGLASISLTLVSKFSAKNANYDVANTAPPWVALEECFVTIRGAETAGTTQDPKLAVTHSAAATSVMSYFMGSGFWGA